MKQYVIDELRPEDYEKVKAHLDETIGSSGSDGLYWLPVDESLLTDVQDEHTECKPLYFSLELVEPAQLNCELLVRTLNRMRCDCIAYATEAQRNWLIDRIDSMFEKLGIIT